ncbi:hypothetical protein ACFFRR_006904 [Megaselia abdita]
MSFKKEYPDLSKICRLCLKEDAAEVGIFAGGLINVSMRIMQVSAIEVQSSDDLPNNICEDCRIQLEKSYLFRKRCQISDNKLKKHLRFVNAGRVSKVFQKSDEDDDEEFELEDSKTFLKKVEDNEKKLKEFEKINMRKQIMQDEAKKRHDWQEQLKDKYMTQYQKEKLKYENELREKNESQKREWKNAMEEEANNFKKKIRSEIKEEESKRLILDLQDFIKNRTDSMRQTASSSGKRKYPENGHSNESPNKVSKPEIKGQELSLIPVSSSYFDNTDPFSRQKKPSLLDDSVDSYVLENLDTDYDEINTEGTNNGNATDVTEDYDNLMEFEIEDENLRTRDKKLISTSYIYASDDSDKSQRAKVSIPKPNTQKTTPQKRVKVLYPKKPEPVQQKPFPQSPVRPPIKTEPIRKQNPRPTIPNPRPKPEPVQNVKPKKNPIYTPKKESPKNYRNLYSIEEQDDDSNSTTYNITNDDYDDEYEPNNPTVVKMEYSENSRNSDNEINLFKCKFCPREFSEPDQLALHSKTHIQVKKELFRCSHCLNTFNSKDLLERHERTHSQPVLFRCSTCSISFMTKELLERHERTHTNPVFQERKSSLQCRSEEELRFGNNSKSTDRERFGNTSNTSERFGNTQHLNTPKRNDRFGKISNSNTPERNDRLLTGNYRIIDEDEVVEEEYECQENTPSKRPTIVKVSYNENTGSLGKINPDAMSNINKELKIFKCNMCSQAFTRPVQLERHMNVHIKSKKEHECDICSKAFPSLSTLERHKRIHTGEKPYQCRFCSKRFVQKEIMKRHETIHMEVKTFKCDHEHCDKSFSQKKQLDKHINEIHLGIVVLTRFQCHLCTKVCVTVYRIIKNSYYLLGFRNSIMVPD